MAGYNLIFMRYLLIIFLFLPGMLAAQDSTARRSLKEYYDNLEPIISDTCPLYGKPPIILKTSLISPFQKHRIGRLGIELPVYRSLTAQATGGYIFAYDKNTYRLNHQRGNYEFGADLKYYFPLITVIRLYTGPVINYRQLNAYEGKFSVQNITAPNGTVTSNVFIDMQNPAIVREEQIAYLWQAGVQPLLKEHIALDIFIAFGRGMNKRTRQEPASEAREVTNSSSYLTQIGMHLGYAF